MEGVGQLACLLSVTIIENGLNARISIPLFFVPSYKFIYSSFKEKNNSPFKV